MKKEIIEFNTSDVIELSPLEDTLYSIVFDKSGQGQKSLVVTLEVPNVSCKIQCGYKLSEGQVVDLTTTVIHKALSTSSSTVVKGVLFDGGISNYVGKIVIQKNAQGSSSKLEDRILVVGEGTKNHSEPILQIDANDVTASHASSTGRVDEDQLYYLQSRGLSRGESQDLLVEAFLAPVESEI